MLPSQKPFRGTQLNRTHPLAKGLVGCWLFNEMNGETVFDLSGHGNNGTLENGVAWGSNGLGFDGVNDDVLIGADDVYKTEHITLSCWVKRAGNSSGLKHTLLSISYNWTAEPLEAPYASYALFYDRNSNSELELFLGYTDDTYDSHITTGGTLALNTWHHVVATYDGVRVKIYLDGVIKYNELESKNVKYYTVTPDPLLFGDTAASNNEFNGSIASTSIYNRALSAEEIARLSREPYTMFEPAFNPALLYSAAPPVGAIMNQFQKANIGADLYNGVFA